MSRLPRALVYLDMLGAAPLIAEEPSTVVIQDFEGH